MSEINPITREEMFLAAASGQNIQLPEPITRVEMFLAKIAGGTGGGTGGGSSAPADWNAAEGQPGHVLNRTHWVEQGDVVIVPEQTVEVDAELGAFLISSNRPLVIGAKYTVHWNGTVYECTAYESEGDTTGLGNLALISPDLPDTGEPFFMLYIPEMGLTTAMSEEATATVYITTFGETIHCLDEKFLPMDEIAAHVLNTLPTWNGGSY